MVSENNTAFVNKVSFRSIGASAEEWLENPKESVLGSYLSAMKKGEIESLTLYGKSEERLFIVNKPGFYHVTIFLDESEGYGYSDGTGDTSSIDIAGDYWPSFRICKDFMKLGSIVHEFFVSGTPSASAHWIHFSDDD
jgi:hypothetical protein